MPMQTHFRIPVSATLATGLSLGGYALCAACETTAPWLVGLGLLLAFAGFVGVSLALILDSDHEEPQTPQPSKADSSSVRE